MSGYDFDRPFISQEAMAVYRATDRETASRYGSQVKAAPLSNAEYRTRFLRLKVSNNMRGPPDGGRIFPGYLVVRNLGTKDQYETWIPDGAFEDLYELVSE